MKKEYIIISVISLFVISIFTIFFIVKTVKNASSSQNYNTQETANNSSQEPEKDKNDEPENSTQPEEPNQPEQPSTSEKPSTPEKPGTPENPSPTIPDISSLTLEQKIAQMLIISQSGTTLSNEFRKELKTYQPGGFILFANNLSNYNQTVTLIKDIQSTASIPMFISMDQEGGKVQRFKNYYDVNITTIPSMEDLGKTGNFNLANSVGTVIAEELRTIGVNMDFAPVLDVIYDPNNTVIGNRSFGTDKTLVAQMGIALGQGIQNSGVIPVYKHFPGHGSTAKDSHNTLPIITKSKEELLNTDLVPFIDAINSGAEVIMVGHLSVPSLSGSNTPASISKTIITDFLKNELNYQGLVVTDGLNMKALTNTYSESEILINAINAGVDLLLMPTSCSSAVNIIKNAVQSGAIPESRINESVTKILTLKAKYLTNYTTLPKSYLGSQAHQDIIKQIPTN